LSKNYFLLEAVVKSSRKQKKQSAKRRKTAAREFVHEDFEMLGNAAIPSAAGFTTAY
jgi:hypothetical protein|tara:strand:+ start:377 stop:547 length:171 start_codon:yes stop_codon:yes gene_type:complete